MEEMRIQKCAKCGSEHIQAEENETGIKVSCKECGNAILVNHDDEMISRFLARNLELFNAFKRDYISGRWNQEQARIIQQKNDAQEKNENQK